MIKNGDGPTLMLRTDLDALPVTEQTGLGYASKVKVDDPDDGVETGVMHACGHDIHITNLVGVARYLAGATKIAWRGHARLDRPAGRGTRHRRQGDARRRPVRTIPQARLRRGPARRLDRADRHGRRIASGYSLANVDSVDITCRGRGGHGAYPHTTIDPIVHAAQLVLALQTIVSREVEAARSGRGHRRLDPRRHEAQHHRRHVPFADHRAQLLRRSATQLLESIERKAKGVAIAAGAPEPIVEVSEGTPSLFNDAELDGPTRASVSSEHSAKRTFTMPSPRWAAKISAAMARPACRS